VNIRRDILLKYLEQAAIEQIAIGHKEQVYEITIPTDDFGAD